MLDKIRKRLLLCSGLLFLSLSLLLNIIEILFIKSAHIYDIIHVFPTIFIYEPIINIFNLGKLNQIYFVILAVIIDFFIGILIGFIFTKFKYTKDNLLISLMIAFFIYWFVVTFQWIPII